MKLILQALLLAFAIFFSSVESSSQSGSNYHSAQGSTGRISGEQRGNSRRPSYSVESVESGISRAPSRMNGERSPSPVDEHLQATSAYSAPSTGLRPSQNSRYSGAGPSNRNFENSGSSRNQQVVRPNSPRPANSIHESESSRDSSSYYSFDPSSVSFSLSIHESPRGPFSFERNSPSNSQSGSNNNSPNHSPNHSPNQSSNH